MHVIFFSIEQEQVCIVSKMVVMGPLWCTQRLFEVCEGFQAVNPYFEEVLVYYCCLFNKADTRKLNFFASCPRLNTS